MEEIIVVIFDVLCFAVQVCREGRLIRRNADTHKLTLKSLHYISSFLPAGLLVWQANRPGSLEWKDLDRRAANTSPLPHPGSSAPPWFYSLPQQLWTAMYMRCSHFNLSQSESMAVSTTTATAAAAYGSIYHNRRLHELWISGGRHTLAELLEQNTHLRDKHQTDYSHTHTDPSFLQLEPLLLTAGLQR